MGLSLERNKVLLVAEMNRLLEEVRFQMIRPVTDRLSRKEIKKCRPVLASLVEIDMRAPKMLSLVRLLHVVHGAPHL